MNLLYSASETVAARVGRRPKRNGRNRNLTGALFLLPSFLMIAAVAYYPILRNFYLSFFDIDIVSPTGPQFVGLGNYIDLLHDDQFFNALKNTAIFTLISVPVEFVLGLIFALALNASFKGRRLARASALIPWALPTAVMAMAWSWIYNDQYGILGHLLVKLGIVDTAPAFLADPTTAMGAAIFADVWKTTPFIFIILLAGLQSIPAELYEAADIDGASGIKRFFTITLPLLRPTIMVSLMFRTIQALGVFDLIWVLTAGGPGGATETLSLYTYDTAFRYLELGYGAAQVVVTFLIILGVAGLISLINRTTVEY